MGLMKPKYMKYDYHYFDEESEQWKIKEDAPQWAKDEFEEFQAKSNPVPDENEIITQY